MIYLFLLLEWTQFLVTQPTDPPPCRWLIGYYDDQSPVFQAEMFGVGEHMECPTNFVVTTRLCPIVTETNGTWTITFQK